jgi:hypothetical protein
MFAMQIVSSFITHQCFISYVSACMFTHLGLEVLTILILEISLMLQVATVLHLFSVYSNWQLCKLS